MEKAMIKPIFLNLNIAETSYQFSASIEDALAQAQGELETLHETVASVNALRPSCDRLDYILAASSGALCGIIDLFLVGKPGESPLGLMTDQWFAARTMDFATMCHPEKKRFTSLESAVRFLEKIFKVPYDQTGLGDAGSAVFGMNAANHHFKSLAHNPSLLGLFFSILDQFANTSHFVTNGQLVSLQQANGQWQLQGGNILSKLFCGFVNWFGHLVSDVSGSQSSARAGNRGMGIPSPLWTWTNDLIAMKAKLGLPVSEIDKAMNELALTIFEQGYDVRFQTAQAIPVVCNELLVRFFYAVRRLFRYFTTTKKTERSFKLLWQTCEPFSNPTVKRMLTVAHGTFCLVDIGDATARAFVLGGGSFHVVEFVLRLNIVGVGRLTISLYGETKRAIWSSRATREADAAQKTSIVVEHYIEGLKWLARKYDDAHYLTFVADFEKSEAYEEAFGKSVALAQLRNVPESKLLTSKSDIEKYFGGK